MKDLNDNQLNEKIKSLVVQERSLLNEILIHIREVDRRKIFLRMAYPNLFEYLTKEIGYSSGAAQRRIDAARLSERVPEILNRIKEGALNLSQVSKVQKACRLVKKEFGQAVPINFQQTVLKKIEGQSSAQTDIILGQEFKIDLKTHEQVRTQKDKSVRVELTFSEEEMGLIEQARSAISNKTGGALKETILEMARKILKEPKRKTTATVAVDQILFDLPAQESTVSQTTTPKSPALKSVTPRLRREILKRDQVCQFRDKTTGRICGSKYFLEVDHIQPRYLKGENGPENLRAMCKNHNIFRYEAGL